MATIPHRMAVDKLRASERRAISKAWRDAPADRRPRRPRVPSKARFSDFNP
jgi:hypothetical protein